MSDQRSTDLPHEHFSKGHPGHERPFNPVQLKDDLKKFKKLVRGSDIRQHQIPLFLAQRIKLDAEINYLNQKATKRSLTNGEITDLAYAEDIAQEMDDLALKVVVVESKQQQDVNSLPEKNEKKMGQIVRLSRKKGTDRMMRLEQNLGCELPVCVSNRSDVKKESIEVIVDGRVIWKLERSALSLLPAPEHYPIWLWFLDRCRDAAKTGCEDPPRIPINLSDLAGELGRKADGRWYQDVDEAFSRFARLVITKSHASYLPGGISYNASGAFGTLCSYASWRTLDPSERETLIDDCDGWVSPCLLVWLSIKSSYIKAIPLIPLQKLKTYTAQRLFLFLSKHCAPEQSFKISLHKLLPKIPVHYPGCQVKTRMKTHHNALLKLGFLACDPLYEGRGQNLMVTYTRTRLDP